MVPSLHQLCEGSGGGRTGEGGDHFAVQTPLALWRRQFSSPSLLSETMCSAQHCTPSLSITGTLYTTITRIWDPSGGRSAGGGAVGGGAVEGGAVRGGAVKGRRTKEVQYSTSIACPVSHSLSNENGMVHRASFLMMSFCKLGTYCKTTGEHRTRQHW